VVQEAQDTVAEPAEERRQRKDAIKSDNETKSGNANRNVRDERPRHDDSRRRNRRDDDIHDGTIGFGGDVPAFMQIAPKI
jgi:hypothetical protein